MLSSVTIAEIVEELSGTVLSAEENVDQIAESFMVGAMGQDKAMRFFRRRPRKVVVTGGDRSDVQLAALETDTRALVLTGDLPPSAHVLSRAEELGVPMVLVASTRCRRSSASSSCSAGSDSTTLRRLLEYARC
jgi:uncharacterized protein